MKRIVIIGNGAAGNSAAETIRRNDCDVEIVMAAIENFPEYSACALPDCLSGHVERKKLFIKDPMEYDRTGIQTMFGVEISRIDPGEHSVICAAGSMAYDRLIIATGSRSFVPPVPGSKLNGNFTLKTVGDIDSIIAHEPRQVLVIGSGNIGIEAAEALQVRGCEVTVVELMDRIMPKIFDEEPSGRIARILSDRGINIFTGEKVLEITGESSVQGAVTDRRTIPCDTVIWAAGVKQNVEIASEEGISIGKLGGIEVNSYMQTNIDDIYACGDCIESRDMLTGYPCLSMLWPNAKRQAHIAALNCLGGEIEYEGSVSFVAEDIYGVTAVSMGISSDVLTGQDIEVIERENNSQYWRVLVMDDRIMGMQAIGVTSGLGAIMAMMKTGTLLSDFFKTVDDPFLLRKMPWYFPACRFFADDRRSGC